MRIAEQLDSPLRGRGLKINTRKARLARMRACVITGAEHHQQATTGGGFRWRSFMVTLTYRRDDQWRPEHITTALKAFREWCRRAGAPCRYVWTAELQQRGAVHYHIVIWLPMRYWLPKWDKRGWWPHGASRNDVVRKSAVGYVAKYASKMANDEAAWQLKFPKGLRMHGCGGLSEAQAMQRRWALSPVYVREYWDSWLLNVHRARIGGGWVSRATGEWLASKWHLGDISAPFVKVWETATHEMADYVDYRSAPNAAY